MEHPLKTFICYAHEDRQVVDDLREHLTLYEKKKLLEVWYDGKILAGEKWDDSIKNALKTADLVLMFISVKFINSEYIEKTELQEALNRHRAGEATLIPIIVSSCDWGEYFEIGQFQALPNQAKPILSHHFPHKADAYHEVAVGIKQTAQNMGEKKRALREKAEVDRMLVEQQRAAELEKNEKVRHRRDEATWKKVLADAEKADDPEHKIISFETYLADAEHLNHREEAEEKIADIQADLAATLKLEEARKAAIRKKVEAAKAAEEQKRKEEETRKAELRKKEDAAKAAEEQRQREAAEQKRKEEAATQKKLPEMVLVKGGTFQMGSPKNETGRYDDEVQHAVTLSDFEIGKYPVTQKLWSDIMGNNPSSFKGDDLPVEQVSWDDCQEFLKKLNHKTGKKYRLPTEAEWEFAARGGAFSKGFLCAGSNDLNEVGWFWENSGDKTLSGEWKAELVTQNKCRTHPVGQKKANELDLFDMSGNVWEWCADWYEQYPSGAQTNPVGPASGSYRVLRGGSWGGDAQYCRVARRLYYAPGLRFYSLGFRLASSPQ